MRVCRVPAVFTAVALFLICAVSFAAGNDGYEAVALAARKTVSGKNLVIIAYTVIIGFLALYALSIWIRERRVRKELRNLMKSIESRKPNS